MSILPRHLSRPASLQLHCPTPESLLHPFKVAKMNMFIGTTQRQGFCRAYKNKQKIHKKLELHILISVLVFSCKLMSFPTIFKLISAQGLCYLILKDKLKHLIHFKSLFEQNLNQALPTGGG